MNVKNTVTLISIANFGYTTRIQTSAGYAKIGIILNSTRVLRLDGARDGLVKVNKPIYETTVFGCIISKNSLCFSNNDASIVISECMDDTECDIGQECANLSMSNNANSQMSKVGLCRGRYR